MDPLKLLEAKVDEIKASVRVAVETAILREFTRVALSRLKTLDPSRQADYSTALQTIGEGE